MLCEMCGKNVGESLYKARVEGTVIQVCQDCTRFGTILQAPAAPSYARGVAPQKGPKGPGPISAPIRAEIEEMVVEDYPALIRKAREKLGLTQQEFARKINEKESVIHNLESGSMVMSIPLARKLGKACNIRLVQEVDTKTYAGPAAKRASDTLTLGDVVSIRKHHVIKQ